MAWFDHFYSSSVAIPISLIVLAAISLLSWRKRGTSGHFGADPVLIRAVPVVARRLHAEHR